MKDLIKSIKEKELFLFENESSFGHVQFNKGNWAIFFNGSCVHISKTLNPVIKKLEKLGIKEIDFIEN